MGDSKNYEMRSIRPEDNAQVAQLIRTVMTEFGAVGPGYSIEDPEVDRMADVYTLPKRAFFVVVDGDRILGCGGVGPLVGADETICELKKMYFYPELRGLGYGKMMVEACLKTAKAFAYKTMYLETVARMEKANLLYQKMGFKKLDHFMGSTGHSACDLAYARSL